VDCNVTGLVWENKTSDGGIHDVNRQFNYTNAPCIFRLKVLEYSF
jgi:hypothetical protein